MDQQPPRGETAVEAAQSPPPAPLPTPLVEEPAGAAAPTRASGFWAAVVAGVVVLIVLIVFILENTQQVRVTLFGASWRLPLGVSLLLAAAIGALVVVTAGTARILELRRRGRRDARRLAAAARAQRGEQA